MELEAAVKTSALTPADWDRFVQNHNGHILQTAQWGSLKSAFGWEHRIVWGEGAGKIAAGASLLLRRLPFGLGCVAYIPRGPLVDWEDEPAVQAQIAILDRVTRASGAAFLKVEPDVADSPAMRGRLSRLGFRLSPQTVQPPRTIVIDLAGSEDDLLARMNQGTRRKIRTAQKHGVIVRQAGAESLASFTALSAVTGERDGFGVHSPAYFERVFRLFVPERAALLMASYNSHDLAGLMVFALGKRAWYLYGASSNEERERMPNYALQWEAMRWARERGCTEYDLWGIPDAPEATLEDQFQTRQDGLWGVYGFKRGFGGHVQRSAGAWDRVYNPFIYAAYRLLMRHQRD